jgi:hypothetical protein
LSNVATAYLLQTQNVMRVYGRYDFDPQLQWNLFNGVVMSSWRRVHGCVLLREAPLIDVSP